MSSRKMLRLTLLGVVFIAVVVGIMFALRFSRSGSTDFVMPPPAQSSDAEELPPGVGALHVSADNVQLVIEKLERPAEYSRSVQVETFWDGGSSVDSFDVSVRDGVTAVRTFFAGTSKYMVITDSYTYIWYTGDSEPVRAGNFEDFSENDEYQRLLTYEDILAVKKSLIVEAGFYNDAAGPGIFVRYLSESFGYLTEVRVSTELGLVTGAEIYDGETLIYRMSAGACSLETPGDTVFILPNGINTLE